MSEVRAATTMTRLAAMAILVVGLTVGLRADTIDRVLAVAAGDLIMLTDVTAARDLGLVPSSGPDPIRAILSQLIDRALVLAEVDRYAPPEPGADAVDREVQRVRARLATAQAFASALARSGIDENHLRETLRQDLRIRAYEQQRFTVAAPGDDEIARYYRDHPGSFTLEGRVAPLDSVRADVVRAIVDDRRAALITDWVGGLRRRADVIDLYVPADR